MSNLKMPEVNYVIVSGHLTKDPVFHLTNSNKTPVINFYIASHNQYLDSKSVQRDEVSHIGIVAWNKLAEKCRLRLKKGSAVLVDGELQSRNWKNEEGFNRCTVEVKAKRIQFLNKQFDIDWDEVEKLNEVSLTQDELVQDYTEDSFDKFSATDESNLNNN